MQQVQDVAPSLEPVLDSKVHLLLLYCRTVCLFCNRIKEERDENALNMVSC
jgi:thioredoxin-related protein